MNSPNDPHRYSLLDARNSNVPATPQDQASNREINRNECPRLSHLQPQRALSRLSQLVDNEPNERQGIPSSSSRAEMSPDRTRWSIDRRQLRRSFPGDENDSIQEQSRRRKRQRLDHAHDESPAGPSHRPEPAGEFLESLSYNQIRTQFPNSSMPRGNISRGNTSTQERVLQWVRNGDQHPLHPRSHGRPSLSQAHDEDIVDDNDEIEIVGWRSSPHVCCEMHAGRPESMSSTATRRVSRVRFSLPSPNPPSVSPGTNLQSAALQPSDVEPPNDRLGIEDRATAVVGASHRLAEQAAAPTSQSSRSGDQNSEDVHFSTIMSITQSLSTLEQGLQTPWIQEGVKIHEKLRVWLTRFLERPNASYKPKTQNCNCGNDVSKKYYFTECHHMACETHMRKSGRCCDRDQSVVLCYPPERNECSICEDSNRVLIFSCGHTMCRSCHTRLPSGKLCPHCRADISFGPIARFHRL